MSELELLGWLDFKEICITRKNLNCQFTETSSRYDLYGPESDGLLWHTAILKSDPRNAFQVDFEDNYKVDFNRGSCNSGTGSTGITKSAEVTITARVETDMPGVIHTVSANKSFLLISFNAATSSPRGVIFRLKVNNIFLHKITLSGEGSYNLPLPLAIKIASAGDIIKVTYDAALARGGCYASFMGVEI